MKSNSTYLVYPYGMTMSGRHGQATDGYRYGFNGMEADDEIKNGDKNSYDFGARMYDPRVGRWLSIDPLVSKYPNHSPYIMIANNPVIYQDFDGKDYILVINHEEKTITVKATFYTTESMKSQADDAVLGWNEQSGKFSYTIGKGSDAVDYKINFELTVKDINQEGNPILTAIDASFAYEQDKSGAANTYKVGDYPDVLPDHGYTENNPYLNRGASEIRVLPGKQEQRKTGTHEIGHTLGILHWTKGLMKKGPMRADSETQITKNMVFRILKTAGIASNSTSSGMDYEMIDDGASDEGRAKATTVNEGNKIEPSNFHTGKMSKND